MATSTKYTGKARSVPEGMGIAGAVSMAITLAGSITLAWLLDRETVSWEQAGYWIMGMLFASSFLGGKSAIGALKRQKMLVSILAGILYWGLLLCVTALFFGGDFGSVWETGVVILAGCGCAALISLPTGKKYRPNGRRNYR